MIATRIQTEVSKMIILMVFEQDPSGFDNGFLGIRQVLDHRPNVLGAFLVGFQFTSIEHDNPCIGFDRAHDLSFHVAILSNRLIVLLHRLCIHDRVNLMIRCFNLFELRLNHGVHLLNDRPWIELLL